MTPKKPRPPAVPPVHPIEEPDVATAKLNREHVLGSESAESADVGPEQFKTAPFTPLPMDDEPPAPEDETSIFQAGPPVVARQPTALEDAIERDLARDTGLEIDDDELATHVGKLDDHAKVPDDVEEEKDIETVQLRVPPVSSQQLPAAPVAPPPPASVPSVPAQPTATDAAAQPSSVPSMPAQPAAAPIAPASTPSVVVAVAAQDSGGYRELGTESEHFIRDRRYVFLGDAEGRPIVLGSGRFSIVFLGRERLADVTTGRERLVALKLLRRGGTDRDTTRFQMEQQVLESVQDEPGVMQLLGLGVWPEAQLPRMVAEQVVGHCAVLEKLDLTLDELLKGSFGPTVKDDLLALDMPRRLLRAMEYVFPVASTLEFAHVIRNVPHRSIKPNNILIRLPRPELVGGTLEVRLGDFSTDDDEPGDPTTANLTIPTFDAPEQLRRFVEMVVQVQQGSPNVAYDNDFGVPIGKGDVFTPVPSTMSYPIHHVDRARRTMTLAMPFQGPSHASAHAIVRRSSGRPADVYSLGALLYHLITGAVGNPRLLHARLEELVASDLSDTIDAHVGREYAKLEAVGDLSLRDPNAWYRHYLDGNGEVVPYSVLSIVARAMVRSRSDSFCQLHDAETTGASTFVRTVMGLYGLFGLPTDIRPRLMVAAPARPSPIQKAVDAVTRFFR